jgi:hypothetical protein
MNINAPIAVKTLRNLFLGIRKFNVQNAALKRLRRNSLSFVLPVQKDPLPALHQQGAPPAAKPPAVRVSKDNLTN